MPIHLTHETRDAIGANAEQCENRSLYFDRFADPTLEKDERKKWFERGCNIPVPAEAQRDRTAHFAGATFLHARLMSRLMVNMAGGVMENAGLSLDRYGLPIIPGSAVKGCARRMALQALNDWVAAGTDRPALDDACAPCCEDFTTPAEMLAAIARIFGWVEQDWKIERDGTSKSDFAWASTAPCISIVPGSALSSEAPMGRAIPAQGNALGKSAPDAPSPEGATQLADSDRRSLWKAATEALAQQLHLTIPAKHTNTPWLALPDFAGTIAFLAATPNIDPRLELDVVTPHHTKYYESNDPNAVATDTEDPIPVIFPAVKAQKETEHFTFPLIPLRRAQAGDILHAKRWLANGLELLGIGAKTNAGYGWFEVPELAQQHQVWDEKKAAAEAALEAIRQEQEEADLALQNAPLLAIQPEQARLDHFATLKPDPLRACINKFQFEDKFWPKPPADEASDSYQVSLFIYLTETNPSLYDEEKSKPKSKVLLALQKLATKYARKLPA